MVNLLFDSRWLVGRLARWTGTGSRWKCVRRCTMYERKWRKKKLPPVLSKMPPDISVIINYIFDRNNRHRQKNLFLGDVPHSHARRVSWSLIGAVVDVVVVSMWAFDLCYYCSSCWWWNRFHRSSVIVCVLNWGIIFLWRRGEKKRKITDLKKKIK